MASTHNEQDVKDFVRERYGQVARATAPATSSCCGPSAGASEFAERLGYTRDELQALPEGANMALSCGNPVALATLKPGEVVVDLGSGGGFDCFIAGTKVGSTGRVVGVDMTPDMLGKARRGLAQYRDRTGLDNVEFRLGEIEHLPLADASADVVISNCVLNLSADKAQVWREIGRALRPGGRVAISDIALLKPIPDELKADLRLLSACVAGAVSVPEMEAMIRDAGLTDIAIEPKADAADIWESYSDPVLDEVRKRLPAGARLSDYAASVNVSARKAGAATEPCCDASSEAAPARATESPNPVPAAGPRCC